MKRIGAAVLFALTLSAAVAFAQPAMHADLTFGAPRIVLEGAWQGATYTVFRSAAPSAPAIRVGSEGTLCTGDCFVRDAAALPGATYWYRFDVTLGDGTRQTFGPTPVAIGAPVAPGLGVSVGPNPTRGRASLRLTASPAGAVAGGVSPRGGTGVAAVYDVRGRLVRELFRAPLDRLSWSVEWDGRDAAGAAVPAGIYFVRFANGSAIATARLTVTR